MRKPENIVYWLNDRPPSHIGLAVAFQQLAFLSVYLIVSPFFARTLNLDTERSLQMVSATLIASSIGVVLQSLRGFGIGAGLFCPMQALAATFAALNVANTLGDSSGFAKMFGAVGMVGLSQMGFAFLFERMRGVFNLQIAGVAVLLIGMGLGHRGLQLIITSLGSTPVWHEVWVLSLATLGVMILCNVWFRGFIHLFSAFIGVSVGTLFSVYRDGVPDADWLTVQQASWFYLPQPMLSGWSVEVESFPAILLTGLLMALHAFGGLVAAQRFNDADWRRPEMSQIRRGILTEGLTNLLGSFLNAIPITSSGGAVSMAAATGCTSRHVAFWLAGLMLLLAFMPKAILFWSILPDEVIGAAMLFLGCFTLMSGFQIVTSSLLDNRKILAIGLGILAGTSFDPLREAIAGHINGWFMPALFSGLSVGILTALVLTMIFRLGTTTREKRQFDTTHTSLSNLSDFLEQQGKSWGAAANLVQKSIFATWQAFELLTEYDFLHRADDGTVTIEVETISTDLSFSVILRYAGHPVPLARTPPTPEQLIEDEEGVLQMAGYMIRQLSDEASVLSYADKPLRPLKSTHGQPAESTTLTHNQELRLNFNL